MFYLTFNKTQAIFCYSNQRILDFNSYSGVPNGDSNHENAGDGAPRGENRGGRTRRYNNRGPRRSQNSESGGNGNGKPTQGEKVNNFEN